MSAIEVKGLQGRLTATVEGGGTATPVLFVHSDAGRRSHWDAQLRHLAAIRRAIALDLRGAGESETPRDGDQSFAGRAGDIGAVLDQLGIDRAVIVGHSGGAAVALTFAVAHPERVAGLLLLDPAGDPASVPEAQRQAYLRDMRGPGYEALARAYYGSLGGPNREVTERVIVDLLATPKATVIDLTEALNTFEPKRLLGRYDGPTLVVVTPATDQPWMLHRMGALPYRIVEGTGHWIHLDKPDEFNAILDELLAGIDRA